MGHKAVFSVILAAALAHMPPVMAQSQDQQAQDRRDVEGQPSPEPAPIPEPRSAPAPVAEAKERGQELADRDFVPTPPEGPRPEVIDPSAARRRAVAIARS